MIVLSKLNLMTWLISVPFFLGPYVIISKGAANRMLIRGRSETAFPNIFMRMATQNWQTVQHITFHSNIVVLSLGTIDRTQFPRYPILHEINKQLRLIHKENILTVSYRKVWCLTKIKTDRSNMLPTEHNLA